MGNKKPHHHNIVIVFERTTPVRSSSSEKTGFWFPPPRVCLFAGGLSREREGDDDDDSEDDDDDDGIAAGASNCTRKETQKKKLFCVVLGGFFDETRGGWKRRRGGKKRDDDDVVVVDFDQGLTREERQRRRRRRRRRERKKEVPKWEQKELEKMRNVRYSQPRPATEKKIESDKEYEALKSELKTLTLKYGAGLSAYCLLGYGVASSLSSIVGVIGAMAYLQFLSEYVDTVNEERDGYKEEEYTRNLVYEPVTDVKKLVLGPESVLGKIATIYSRALFQKRLIVPVLVVASESLWNHIPGHPFDFNYGVTLLGFLTYKASALTVTYGTLKPLLQEDAKNAGNYEYSEDDDY